MVTRLSLDDAERARVVDVSRRLRPVSRAAIGLLFLAALLGVPSYGWAPPAAIAGAALVFSALRARMHRMRRPEVALAASWLLAQLTIAGVVLVATGPREYLFALFAFPMMLAGVVWPTRAVVAGAVLSSLGLIGVALATEAELILSAPPVLTHQIALVLATALVASIARDAEVAARDHAVVDQLTRTLNRTALEARAGELEQRHAARATSAVALVVGDVDGFKRVNDEHGHAMGDLVLHDIAERLRSALPAFAGLYRYGGEEFVVVLPGMGVDEAAAMAEGLRAAVGDEPIAGLPVTMSFGVGATAPGEPFTFDALFARADGALYGAKHAGRDRVNVADQAADVAPLRSGRGQRRRAADVAALPGAAPATAAPAPVLDREPSWLADATQRQHLVDLSGRLRRANHVPYLIAFAATIFLGPWFGWWPVVPVVVGSIVYRAVERRLPGLRRPEFWLGGAWLVAQTGNALAFVVADIPAGQDGLLWALPLLVLMVVGSSAVFPARGAVAGVLYTGALILGVMLLLEPATVAERPSEMVFVFALLAAIGLVGSAIGSSAVHHRGAAIVDQLTGLLNRRALDGRSAELAHQSASTGAPVAVIVGDVDHFKRVNDEHGHAAGDVVLRAIAERLRTSLRAFEDLYRCGGEEFVVVLAGATTAEATEAAERLRAAIAGEPVTRIPVTMSFGVAATEPGEAFDLERVRARADAALYQAKANGRDRVEGAETTQTARAA